MRFHRNFIFPHHESEIESRGFVTMEMRKPLAVLQKAKELLNYTNARTKIVSADISANKFQQALHEISELSDVDQMRDACYSISRSVKNSHKYGFSKQAYHAYGSKMREIAYEILEGIITANSINFQTLPQSRIDEISQVLIKVDVLMNMVQMCKEMNIISSETCGEWSGKIVKLSKMLYNWKENCISRMNQGTSTQNHHNSNQYPRKYYRNNY